MVARKGSRWGHRDATMILIGYRHGLRASELCDLQWSASSSAERPRCGPELRDRFRRGPLRSQCLILREMAKRGLARRAAMKDFILTLGMIAGITACAGVWQLWKECARLARHIDQLREDVGVWRRIDHE